MNKKNSGKINDRNKSKTFQSQNLLSSDKPKNSKKMPPQLQSVHSQNIFNTNKKYKTNNLTATSNSFSPRKHSEQKIKSVKTSEMKPKKRVFSQSPKKTENNNNNNITIDKEYINVNLSSESYGFNLYKHLKENLRNKDKLCNDILTKETLYCIDCKMSTCKKCLLFHVHKGHNLIPKYIYLLK